jgi:hypothetical protein
MKRNESKKKGFSAEENKQQEEKGKMEEGGWVVDLIVSLWQLLDLLDSRLNQRQREITIQPGACLLSIRTKIEFVENIEGRNLQ